MQRTMTMFSMLALAALLIGNPETTWAQRAQGRPLNCAGDCTRKAAPNPRLSGRFGSNAVSILIYDENTVNQHGLTALANLGLAFTRGTSADFVSKLTSQTWDLVIMDFPSTYPVGDWESAVISHIAGGGRSIISFWALESFPNLQNALQVGTNGSEYGATAVTFKWSAGRPDKGDDRIWTKPNGLNGFIGDGTALWADKGDHLSVLSGATAVGGFVNPPTAIDGSVVIGNGGRTVTLGYLTDLLANDDSGNGKADGVDIFENAIKRVTSVD